MNPLLELLDATLDDQIRLIERIRALAAHLSALDPGEAQFGPDYASDPQQPAYDPRVFAGTKGVPPVVVPFSPTHGPLEPEQAGDDPNRPFEYSGATVRKPESPLGAEVLADHGRPKDWTVRSGDAWIENRQRSIEWLPEGHPQRVQVEREIAAARAALARYGTQTPDAEAPTPAAAPPPPSGPEPLTCEETRRWRLEPTRRDELARSPMSWIQVAVYYCERLAHGQFGDRPVETAVEDLVRCVEALPGGAGDRIEAVFDLSKATRAQYAALWQEAIGHVDAAVAAHTIEIDHQTRLLFCLGSPLTDYQEELATLRDHGATQDDDPLAATVELPPETP